MPCNLVLHFQVLHFPVLHFQRPQTETGYRESKKIQQVYCVSLLTENLWHHFTQSVMGHRHLIGYGFSFAVLI